MPLLIITLYHFVIFQNSIRHNLSLNQYFTKAPRQPMAGKGGYWSMHPDFEEKLVAQAYTKRKKKGIPVFPANSLISKYVLNYRYSITAYVTL